MSKAKETVSSTADKRSRVWTVVLYPDSLPADWVDKLRSIKVQILLSPPHDKDIADDGKTTKKLHHHALLMFSSKKSMDQIFGLFQSIYGSVATATGKGVSIPGVATINDECRVHDKHAMARYLCHLDNPEKAQYDTSGLVAMNGADVMELLKKSLTETQEVFMAIQQFIIDNDITEFCDLADAVRCDRDWYLIVTTKATLFFSKYIQSRRHKSMQPQEVKDDVETSTD